MYRKDVNTKSPLRILEQSIHGGLGRGNLGVVAAPAGVGKTACLVQIGLDDLMRDKDVLHVAIGQPVEHVSAWYDAIFEDLATWTHLEDKAAVWESVTRHRAIKSFAEATFTLQKFNEAVDQFGTHLFLRPQAILVDGFDWTTALSAGSLHALKATARRLGAELWMTAQTPRGFQLGQPAGMVPPCEGCSELIDVALFLEPLGSHVAVRIIKDHAEATPSQVRLQLHPDTLRLVDEGEPRTVRQVPAAGFTLLSGGALGAESEFGRCAEAWGLREVTYSFAGRPGDVRARGLVALTDEELAQGDVSTAYLRAHMHRSYPDTPEFQKVVRSIWHQVVTTGEVFQVGQIMPDKTVRGGTGWAVELARHWGKPVHVFDQEQRGWFTWRDRTWVLDPEPTITRERFTGTGTRFLTDDGGAAVQALFERSFGPRPTSAS